DRLVFIHAVIVTSDGTGADVDLLADLRISQIGEMVCLGSFAQAHLFGFDEVADMSAFADFTSRAEMRIRAQHCVIRNRRTVDDAPVTHRYNIPNYGIADDGIRPDAAVLADDGLAQKLNEGFDDGVRA